VTAPCPGAARPLNNPAAGTYNTDMGLTCWLRKIRRVGALALRALAPSGSCACAAAAAMLLAAPGFCADDFPPPISPESDQPAGSQPPPTAGPPTAPQSGAQDAAAAAPPAPPKPERDVQIEQKRIGRRVAEIIVTPAGFTYHYSMTHLDDQDPGTTLLQPHQELSVPRFFRIDF